MAKITIKNIIDTNILLYNQLKGEIDRLRCDIKSVDRLLRKMTYHEEISVSADQYAPEERHKIEKLIKILEKNQPIETLSKEHFK